MRGIYSRAAGQDEELRKARAATKDFLDQQGRRPRILIAKMGQDGHDRGARIIATGLADTGYDVDISPLFQTPEEVARQSAENDVHVIGVSSMTGGHMTLVPELMKELHKIGRGDIRGIVPPLDAEQLKAQGVLAIYGPGTILSKAAQEIIKHLVSGIE